MVIELNDKNFNKEIEEAAVALVDFWAPWCGPCRAQTPILQKLAESGLSVKVCKVNVDENPQLSQKYGIISIPTLMVFKNGKDVKKVMGLHSLEQLKELVL